MSAESAVATIDEEVLLESTHSAQLRALKERLKDLSQKYTASVDQVHELQAQVTRMRAAERVLSEARGAPQTPVPVTIAAATRAMTEGWGSPLTGMAHDMPSRSRRNDLRALALEAVQLAAQMAVSIQPGDRRSAWEQRLRDLHTRITQ